MTSWTSELGAIIQQLAGNPDSAIEKGVILFVGVVACVIVQFLAARMLSMTMVNVGRATGVMIVCIDAALAAATAARLYLVPLVESNALRPFLPPAAALVAVLAIAAPVACLTEHGNYMQGVASILLAVAAALFVGFLVKAGFGAASQGNREMDKTREHKRQIEKLFHTTPPTPLTAPRIVV